MAMAAMMQLLRGGAPLTLLHSRRLGSRFAAMAGALPSTEELPPLPEGWNDNLFNRVAAFRDPRRSVVPVLERWVQEGNPVDKRYLQGMVKQMRASRRYTHALEISTWISDRRYFVLTPGDIADRLDLIKKVHGLEHAENYFSNIPKQLKLYQVYGALLNCYVEDKCVEKAEAFFQKMDELQMRSNLAYNVLMKMYIDLGQLEKVDAIFQEMKKKRLVPDIFTYNTLIEAYTAGAGTNVEGVKEIVDSIKHAQIEANWYTYAVAAKGYVKAGLIDEALALLNNSKELIPQKKGKGEVAYGYLLSVYADIGNKAELYQVWNMYKSSVRATKNMMYICMISKLLKLDDIEGAESILKEWESVFSLYDFRVPNLLLSAYCKRGLLEKAELLVNKAVESGRAPFPKAWDMLAGLYFRHAQSLKAVEMMKTALVKWETPWKPDPTNVIATLDYLKELEDVEGVEEIAKLLRHHGLLTREIYNCLLKIYVLAGKPTADLLDQMAEDGFNADEESYKILEEESQQDLTRD